MVGRNGNTLNDNQMNRVREAMADCIFVITTLLSFLDYDTVEVLNIDSAMDKANENPLPPDYLIEKFSSGDPDVGSVLHRETEKIKLRAGINLIISAFTGKSSDGNYADDDDNSVVNVFPMLLNQHNQFTQKTDGGDYGEAMSRALKSVGTLMWAVQHFGFQPTRDERFSPKALTLATILITADKLEDESLYNNDDYSEIEAGLLRYAKLIDEVLFKGGAKQPPFVSGFHEKH